MKASEWEGEAPAEPNPTCTTRDGKAREGEAPAEPSSRRHPVHGVKYVHGQPTIIFDTLCTKHRKPALANDTFHAIFREVAAEATAWLLGRYVIMPDHIHFFAGYADGEIPYENWVKYLKSQLTRALGGQDRAGGRDGPGGRGSCRAESDVRARGGRGSRRASAFAWQTDHWDTRIRNADVYEQKWQYILNNPVRKGLVAKAGDWPYQGEVFELRW